MHMICVNGTFIEELQPVLLATNRSYRYGDGFFETIKVLNGQIRLKSYHVTRIEHTILLMDYSLPAGCTIATILEQLITLCKKNNCANSARVRLSFSNGNGGLSDNSQVLSYIIEALPLDTINHINEKGLVTGLFPLMKKGCDEFACIKSSSAFLYIVATRFALLQKWDDCMILNHRENICESSIANIFWIKNNKIFTTALTEGCVAGVMRAYLIDQVGSVTETPCRQQDLWDADEVFLTNAIRGMQWVKKAGAISYNNNLCREIYNQYFQAALDTKM